MKRVKIMLTAITVFAVIGGALAFNTKRDTLICSSVKQTSGCTNPTIYIGSTFTQVTESDIFCGVRGGACDTPAEDIRSNR